MCFNLSNWPDAEIVYRWDNEPGTHEQDLNPISQECGTNLHRVTILEILNSKSGKYYAKKELQREWNEKFIPIKSASKTKRTLSATGFNSLITSLIDWKLIEKRFREGSEKEVEYRITPDGEFTLRFMKIWVWNGWLVAKIVEIYVFKKCLNQSPFSS